MPDPQPERQPRIVLLGLDACEDYETFAAEIRAAGAEPVSTADVFIALAELVAPDQTPVSAVLVDLDALRPADYAFFTLARRNLPDGRLFVLASSQTRNPARDVALAAGAAEIEREDILEWLCEQAPPQPYTDRMVPAPAPIAEKAQAPNEPSAVAMTPAAEPEPAPEPEPEPPAPQPTEKKDVTSRRPAPPPPVPWQPAASRPTRKPPAGRSSPEPRASEDDVQLSAEELNALLNGDAPDDARRAAP